MQPLPRELADALRPWLATKPVKSPVWPGSWRERGWRMIQRDLDMARQAWIAEANKDAEEKERRKQSDYLAAVDADGRVFDFHATRHSYVTLLAKSGANPKATLELARHTSIDQTMNGLYHLLPARPGCGPGRFPVVAAGRRQTEGRARPGDGNGRRARTAPAPNG